MSCIIVLGCFRSGTSAVAGVLHHLGVMMGTYFDQPARANPLGFFEDREFKEIIGDHGFGSDAFKDLVASRERDYPIWGVKDPTFCVSLMDFVDNLPCPHKVISTLRPKADICKSFTELFASESLASTVDAMVEKLLEEKAQSLATYKGKVLEVQFGDLMRKPEETVHQIAEFVGVPFKEEAVRFIDPSIGRVSASSSR